MSGDKTSLDRMTPF